VTAGGRRASAEIGRLSQQVALLSSRDNLVFALPAALLLWATQWAFAIEAWRARAGSNLLRWLDAVGEFEALLAFATLAAEHPEYAFPELVDGPAMLVAEAVAHPVLPASAVSNDVALSRDASALLVVSGSNMSGKSTLLRTVGVNVVLAQAGAPVRATTFRLSPLDVGASINTQDSLADGQSRFFAEISRLKQIVDRTMTQKGRVLFLLDEILAGTNSHDRRIGAEAVLSGLVRAGAIGLATTHDLAIGEIVERLAPRAANVHFEDQFAAGTLTFDYRLRPGVVRSSNAIALMRSIGLDV
jgi:DNA mismatch repair ATPase MutS